MPGIDANTKFISHFNGNNGAKEIVDDGNTGHIVSQIATAQLSTAQKKFGNTSLFLDGNSDRISLPNSTDFDFNTNINDYTIDFHIKFDNHIGVEYIFERIQNALTDFYYISHVDGLGWRYRAFTGGSNDILISGGGEIIDTNWHHIALIRSGDKYAFYVDGVQVNYLQDATIGATLVAPLFIGGSNTFGDFFHGYMDEVRIQSFNVFGASPNAGLTDTINIPVSEHTSDANTKLLLHMNSHDISGDGGSGSYHIPTFNGTAQIDTSIKKFGTGSLFLDGNSDYLQIPDSTDFDIVASISENWTIDCWIYRTVGSTDTIIQQREDASNDFRFRISSDDMGINFIVRIAGSVIIDVLGTSVFSLNTWHHIILIKKSDEYGIYHNGIQIGYLQDTSIANFTGSLYIGRNVDGSFHYFGGYIDDFRIQKSNYFNASPNVGLTDTIIVPTIEYNTTPPLSSELNTRFNPFFGIHEDVDPIKEITINQFTGKHYKNYKKG